MRAVLVCLLGLSSLGCDGGARLLVDLRTDLVPGVEIDEAVTTVTRPAGVSAQRVSLSRADDLLAGVRIADLDGVSGEVELRVAVHRGGAEVLSRPVRVRVTGRRGVTVTLSRDCRGVTCPDGGDANAAACLGGRCVAPECTEDARRPECTEGCGSDPECGAPEGCVTPRCVDGVCLRERDDGVCAPDEACVPDEGCRPTTPPDGGAPSRVVTIALSDTRIVHGLASTEDGHSYVLGRTLDGDDVLVARVDPDGGLQWTAALGAPGSAFPGGVVADASAAIVVGAIDREGAPDALVVGLDATGGVRFSRAVGSSAAQNAHDVVRLQDGDLVIVGPHVVDATDSDAFAARLSPDASEIRWARRYGGDGRDSARSVVGVEDRVFVSGETDGSFGLGRRALVMRIDATDGRLTWARSFGPGDSASLHLAALGDRVVVAATADLVGVARPMLVELTAEGAVTMQRLWSVTPSQLNRVVPFGDALLLLGERAGRAELWRVDGLDLAARGSLDARVGLGALAVFPDGTVAVAAGNGRAVWSRLRPGVLGGCPAWTDAELAVVAEDVDDAVVVDPLVARDLSIDDLESRSLGVARPVAEPAVVECE